MILLIWCLSLLTIRRFLFRHLKFIFIQIIIENFDEGFWIIFFKDFSLKLDLNTIFKISFSDFFFFEIFSAKFCIKWINFYCSRKKKSHFKNHKSISYGATWYFLSTVSWRRLVLSKNKTFFYFTRRAQIVFIENNFSVFLSVCEFIHSLVDSTIVFFFKIFRIHNKVSFKILFNERWNKLKFLLIFFFTLSFFLKILVNFIFYAIH